MNQKEYTIKQALDIIRPIVGSGRVLTLGSVTHLKRQRTFIPRGKTSTRRRQNLTFADIVALGFLLDMSKNGIGAIYCKALATKIQSQREFKKEHVVKGQRGMLGFTYSVGELAEQLLKRIEISA